MAVLLDDKIDLVFGIIFGMNQDAAYWQRMSQTCRDMMKSLVRPDNILYNCCTAPKCRAQNRYRQNGAST